MEKQSVGKLVGNQSATRAFAGQRDSAESLTALPTAAVSGVACESAAGGGIEGVRVVVETGPALHHEFLVCTSPIVVIYFFIKQQF